MRIAIIGTGNVGRSLGIGWARRGHDVMFGSREPESAKVRDLLAAAGPHACAETPAAAAAWADVVVIATPWSATAAVVSGLGDLSGKVVVDAVNPIAPGLQLAVGHDSSGAELLAGWAPGARVVKAFNTTGANNMSDPVYDGRPTTMFICGDDAAAKADVTQLAQALGFDVADVGGLTAARLLEPLALVWIRLAMVQGYGRDIAFKLVRR